jgi:two-component system response regulator MtrA
MVAAMRCVLVIEDDLALGQQVVAGLERAGLAAHWWRTGRIPSEDDLAQVVLVILDLMLPGVAGLDILAAIRSASDVPVLVLSARQDSVDKVRALELGADDYVTKPFWPDELIERVRARLRRPTLQRSDRVCVGALTIDEHARRAEHGGRALELTRVEFELLLALACRAGRPVARSWLLEHVLDPEREAGSRTLDVHVSRLRKKLAEASGGAAESSPIETVWGIGYRLRAEAP